MKKLIILSALIVAGFTLQLAKAATTYADVVPGIDPTGYSTITGSLLYQLVAQAHASTNRGFIIVTNGTPPTTGANAYLTNYLWLDVSTDPPVIKSYSGSSGWASGTVGLLAVGSNNIAVGAVNSSKILDATIGTVDIANNAITTPLLGSESVTMANIANGAVGVLQLAPAAVTSAALTNGAVQTTNIFDGAVTSNKLAPSAVMGYNLATNAITSNNIVVQSINGYDIANGTLSRTNLIPQSLIGSQDLVLKSVNLGTIDDNLTTNFVSAWGLVNSNGASMFGYGYTVAHTALGVYTVTPTTLASTNYAVVVTPVSVAGGGPSAIMPCVSIKASTFIITNSLYNLSANADSAFSFILMGGKQ